MLIWGEFTFDGGLLDGWLFAAGGLFGLRGRRGQATQGVKVFPQRSEIAFGEVQGFDLRGKGRRRLVQTLIKRFEVFLVHPYLRHDVVQLPIESLLGFFHAIQLSDDLRLLSDDRLKQPLEERHRHSMTCVGVQWERVPVLYAIRPGERLAWATV